MGNTDTHIFQSLSSLAFGMGEATRAARAPLAAENEKLRERLQSAVFLMESGLRALNHGDLPKARQRIELARNVARGPQGESA